MGDISRGADTLLTAVFGEHPKSPRLHAIINWNTRDHRNAARPLIHVIPPVRKFFADSVLSLYKICPESRQNSFILYKEDTDLESAWKTVQIF
ncbi:hypothetical protein DPMN_155217 [Dreissena polymorpha]|uniref:Uncharacterized protein n=1 Tax=Dreissena polymorpha TaxID=45954 RepID=A0A9D4JB58_DREPO|nr:hypothetical protein DPMN_155217 [Dreissena polymorpha]